jgi:hypothetical protein
MFSSDEDDKIPSAAFVDFLLASKHRRQWLLTYWIVIVWKWHEVVVETLQFGLGARGIATVFPQTTAAAIKWISKGKKRESENQRAERVLYKLKEKREKSESENSHQMTKAFVRGKTVVEVVDTTSSSWLYGLIFPVTTSYSLKPVWLSFLFNGKIANKT